MSKTCTHCGKAGAHLHVSPNDESPSGDFCLPKDENSISCFEMAAMEWKARKDLGLAAGRAIGGTVRPSESGEIASAPDPGTSIAAVGEGERR